jgi:hypothetical protein
MEISTPYVIKFETGIANHCRDPHGPGNLSATAHPTAALAT